MIESMKKYTFLVLASQYDAFLEKVREAGVVHVNCARLLPMPMLCSV